MATTTPNIGLTLPVGTELRSRAVWNNNFTIIDTNIGTLNNRFAARGSSQSPVTDLSTIPLGFVGNVTIAAAVSPSGNLRSHSVIKWGLNSTRFNILAIDQYQNRMFLYEIYDGTDKGWREIPTDVYSFGGLSSNRTFSFQMKNSCHAQVYIGAKTFMIYLYNNTIYGDTLPSGYTASFSNNMITITRDNDTAYYCHGLVLGMGS